MSGFQLMVLTVKHRYGDNFYWWSTRLQQFACRAGSRLTLFRHLPCEILSTHDYY
jgi:hypothetical protein